MGLFDQLGEGLKGALGQAASGALSQLEANVLTQVMAKTSLGDVNGLLQKLQDSGLGPQVASWLGSGGNMPITAEQLHAALGSQTAQQLAAHFGLPADKLLALLAQNLPAAIDHMSPNGTVQETK